MGRPLALLPASCSYHSAMIQRLAGQARRIVGPRFTGRSSVPLVNLTALGGCKIILQISRRVSRPLFVSRRLYCMSGRRFYERAATGTAPRPAPIECIDLPHIPYTCTCVP